MIRLDYDQNIEGDLVEITITEAELSFLWKLFLELNL